MLPQGWKPEEVKWLWRPYIPRGKLTLSEGDPGIGKSWKALALATAVSNGRGLPGETRQREPETVLLLTAEDGLADTIRPRLDALGADVERVHAIYGYAVLDDEGLAELERHISDVNPALVIIDPLVAYMGAGIDINKANQVRSITAKLATLAEKHGAAILAVRHLTKGSRDKPSIAVSVPSTSPPPAAPFFMLGYLPRMRTRGWSPTRNVTSPPSALLLHTG